MVLLVYVIKPFSISKCVQKHIMRMENYSKMIPIKGQARQ